MKQPQSSATIFYDGDCGLCAGFVRWIQAHDRRHVFVFTPLQNAGESCPLQLDSDPRQWSVILVDSAGVWERSDAVLRIMCSLGGVYRLAWAFRIAPRNVRDSVYRLIARHRR